MLSAGRWTRKRFRTPQLFSCSSSAGWSQQHGACARSSNDYFDMFCVPPPGKPFSLAPEYPERCATWRRSRLSPCADVSPDWCRLASGVPRVRSQLALLQCVTVWVRSRCFLPAVLRVCAFRHAGAVFTSSLAAGRSLRVLLSLFCLCCVTFFPKSVRSTGRRHRAVVSWRPQC